MLPRIVGRSAGAWRQVRALADRVGAEDADRLGLRAQRRDRLGDGRVALAPPRGRRRTCSGRGRWRSGRDSIRRQVDPAVGELARARRPGRPGGPRPARRRRARSSRPRRRSGSVPAGAIQTKRVTLSASSSIPSRRIVAAVELGRGAGADRRPGPLRLGDHPHRRRGAADAAQFDPGQLLAQEAGALGQRLRVGEHRLDLAPARPPRGRSGGRAPRSRARRRSSPRSASKARVSRVPRTEPSIEFSNGTSARSASPRSTARIASWIVAVRSGSNSLARAASPSASSVKVPAGPR